MKRLEKAFFVVLCMIFLFACSHINWINTNEATIEWEAVTKLADGRDIPADREVRYLVYVDNPKTHEEMLVEKYVNDDRIDAEKPIPETSCKIRFKDKGLCLVGVQSVLYNFNTRSFEKPSGISWSDSKIATQNNPFGVRVKK
jgi:hypothetical protein